jgi:hypothetical protein
MPARKVKFEPRLVTEIIGHNFSPNLRPELKKLLGPAGGITVKFCKKFISLLPEEGDGSGWEDGNDSGDYTAWGYALYNDLVEAEEDGQAVWNAAESFGL